MSEYGCGVSMQQAFAYDKERIKKAFENKILSGEDESGFIYADCSPQEAQEQILRAFDNAVSLALQMTGSGRVFERIMKEYHDNGEVPPESTDPNFLMKYMQYSMEEEEKDRAEGTYKFESEADFDYTDDEG